MAAPGAATTDVRAVLVCQSCPYVWEPDSTTSEQFADLVRSGCPDCGGWVRVGELVDGMQR